MQYLVQSSVDGYNVCIFAYGQTGSGKTFTIYGSENNPGLTPRAIAELFKIIKRDGKKFSFSLKVIVPNLFDWWRLLLMLDVELLSQLIVIFFFKTCCIGFWLIHLVFTFCTSFNITTLIKIKM